MKKEEAADFSCNDEEKRKKGGTDHIPNFINHPQRGEGGKGRKKKMRGRKRRNKTRSPFRERRGKGEKENWEKGGLRFISSTRKKRWEGGKKKTEEGKKNACFITAKWGKGDGQKGEKGRLRRKKDHPTLIWRGGKKKKLRGRESDTTTSSLWVILFQSHLVRGKGGKNRFRGTPEMERGGKKGKKEKEGGGAST